MFIAKWRKYITRSVPLIHMKVCEHSHTIYYKLKQENMIYNCNSKINLLLCDMIHSLTRPTMIESNYIKALNYKAYKIIMKRRELKEEKKLRFAFICRLKE